MKIIRRVINLLSSSYLIKITSNPCNHYGHFLNDCVWPLYDWLSLKKLLDKKHVTLYFHHYNFPDNDKNPAIYLKLLNLIFTPKISLIKAKDASCLRVVKLRGFSSARLKSDSNLPLMLLEDGFSEKRIIETYGLLFPEKQKYLSNLQKYFFERFKVKVRTLPKYIILIERAEGFNDQGKARRFIDNHDEIKNSLQAFCADGKYEFVNVKLEEIAFDRQIELFANAKLVVAQHGAGLVNLLFAPEGCGVIELGNNAYGCFKYFCSFFGMRYLNYPFYSSRAVNATVDLLVPKHLEAANKAITVDSSGLIKAIYEYFK